MNQHEQRIVRFLSEPSSYPHPVDAIDRRETHVSHVFLAGSFAYKLKKPVKFPFLDALMLSRRKRFCQLELVLNRRLAPHTYLGMVPMTESRGVLCLGGTGKAVEWLVKMRRLPETRMLDRLIAKRRVGRCDIEAVADRLIPFFRRAKHLSAVALRQAGSRAIDRYGTPAAVSELVLGNLRECQLFVGRIFSEPQRRLLESAYRQYLALHEPLLVRRVREHRIIDGHGDLRCENICLTDPPSVFDCVEFQPAFRCGDVANDFSFLVMDLEFRGRHDLAKALADRYRHAMRDPTFDGVLPFYSCHRSVVRGKVRGFAWLQHPRTAEGRRIRELARRHFALAVRYARTFAPPRLIVVGGLIGSGKSTLAKSLAESLGATWLRTDEIRLTEFAHVRRQGQGFAEGIYSPHVSELVYRRLIQRTQQLLAQDHSVVCDGTFSKAIGRHALRRIARQHGTSFHFFECVVPKAVALRRVAKRFMGKTDISEAQPEHYDRLKAGFESVRHWTARDWTRISDDRAPRATFQAALVALRCAWNIPG